MARDPKPPAFLFYTKDWLSATRSLGVYARGLYIDLLALEWDNGPIDDNPEDVADATGADPKEVKRVWKKLREKFTSEGAPPGKMINLRLEEERQKQRDYRSGASIGGTETAARMTPEQRSERARKAASAKHAAANQQADGKHDSANQQADGKHDGKQDPANGVLASANIAIAIASAKSQRENSLAHASTPARTEGADEVWARVCGVLPGSQLSDVTALCERLAVAQGRDRSDVFVAAVTAFNALCEGENPGFQPQKSPHTFLRRWEDVQEVMAGKKSPDRATAQAKTRAANGDALPPVATRPELRELGRILPAED